MITADRLAAIETNAIALGVSAKQLMESRGNAVAHGVRDLTEGEANVTVVAGRGDNGGSALAAARFLSNYELTVCLLGRPETITTVVARENWDVLSEADYDIETLVDSADVEFDTPDVIVDGVLGPGFTGTPGESERSAIEAINAADAATVSVDVPSGANADGETTDGSVVSADRVVTFHDAKPGLDSHPDVTVADIGIPPAAETFVGPGDLRLVRRHLRGQKREGDTGRIFVIGGGPYTGAPALSAQAALRAGADLSFVAVPDAVSDPIRGYAEDLIVQPFSGPHLTPERVDQLVETATQHDDVVVIGPGLGDEDETRDAVREFLDTFDGKAVVDADALPAVPDVETEATLVLTPNRQELTELGGPSVNDLRGQAGEIESFASDFGHALLVKGEELVVTDGDRTRIARQRTPGMTVGGTGDVLAGVVAAFLGVASPFDAACAGAYLEGRAGEHLTEDFGMGFVSSDLLEAIPAVLSAADGDPEAMPGSST